MTDADGEVSLPATVRILVDTPPDCDDSVASVDAGTTTVLPDFPCEDVDDDREFIVFIDDGAHGTVTIDDFTGEVSYTPDAGFTGTDKIPYYAEDDFELRSPERAMTITVEAVPVPAPAVPTPVATVLPSLPPTAPLDGTPPSVTLKSAAKPLKQTLSKGVAIQLTTNENSTATLTLTVDKATARKLRLDRKARGAVTVGTLKAALTPGSPTVTVKFSSKARRAFKSAKRLKLLLTAVIVDVAGNRTTKTLTVTLKR